MVVREITVIKKARSDTLPDIPINFPPLENLHLELIENKKKLKKGLPPVTVVPRTKPPVIPVVVGAAAAGVAVKVVASTAGGEDVDKDVLDAIGEDEEPTKDDVEKKLGETAQPSQPSPQVPPTAPEPVEEPQPVEDDPYAGLSPEERDAKEKEEYIWRFRILKKQYKGAKIEEFNEHSDLDLMKKTYDRTVKDLYLEDTVESYRTYLVGGFMVMETVCTKFLGWDIDGFTSHQMKVMNKYDRLLIELGEKSYNRWGMNLPVELRLLGFIILQAGVFYLGKIIATKGGSTVGELFKALTGQVDKKPTESENATPAPKKKMRGPSIKVEDLKKAVKEEESVNNTTADASTMGEK
jgi:hypothetical protein